MAKLESGLFLLALESLRGEFTKFFGDISIVDVFKDNYILDSRSPFKHAFSNIHASDRSLVVLISLLIHISHDNF